MRGMYGVVIAVISVALHAPTSPVGTAALAPGDPAAGSSSTVGVAVNEFSPSPPFSPFDEFLELRNTGDQAAALGGWELIACLSPNTWQVATRFPLGAEIAPGGRVLLTHLDYAQADGPDPDYHYDVDVPKDGGWLLVDPWTGHADGVGLASGLDCTEGDPAPECDWAAGEAVTRDEQGKDTDDNSADFTCQARTPGF